MNVEGSRVTVVGGSIAGCAAAIALQRLGADVQVFERSSGALHDRGSGIAIPLALRDELIGADYLRADYPTCVAARRHWVVADGTDDGRLLWRQPGAAAMSNWGVLWRSLRAGVPDDRYHDGTIVRRVAPRDDHVEITLDDGAATRTDVLIGADGYHSTVREIVAGDARPHYAGYILWRGNFPESRLADRTAIDRLDADEAWLTVAFDGGHAVMYPIPDFDDGVAPGERRINWAIYAPQPTALRLDGPSSIPPGAVAEDVRAALPRLLDEVMPRNLRPLFDSPAEEVSIQPVYDESVDHYVRGRVALIGDAGSLSRPHTGSGATKAMQDARCLEALGTDAEGWDPLLAAYDHDRAATGRTLVELSRRIGRDQVEHTPPWASMSEADFEAWTQASLSGEQLYFWGSEDPDETARAISPQRPR